MLALALCAVCLCAVCLVLAYDTVGLHALPIGTTTYLLLMRDGGTYPDRDVSSEQGRGTDLHTQTYF